MSKVFSKIKMFQNSKAISESYAQSVRQKTLKLHQEALRKEDQRIKDIISERERLA